MTLLGAVADDLTGATDLANTLVRAGMRTALLVGLPGDGMVPEVDAAVIALKTRSIGAEAAVRMSLAALQKLREELDRAAVIDPAAFPASVVTMGSTVEFEDLGTNEIEEYTITFPDRADVTRKRMSILAPIGTALIGCRVGDVVNWSTPGGIRQLKVRRVTPPVADPGPATVPAAYAFSAAR